MSSPISILCKKAGSSIWPSAKRKGKQPLSLVDLPTEMLQHIASFLPTSSAAALALCSHSLNRFLGTQYWDKLREPHQEGRIDFLSLLEKDLNDYILCQRCAKLHLPDNRRFLDAYLSPEWRPCFKADMSDDSMRHYHYIFRFEHVQMAMKQHRLGLDSGPHVDHLSNTKTYYMGRCTYQASIKARIVFDNFLLRIQDRVLIPPGQVLGEPSALFTDLCPHLKSFGSGDGRCRLRHIHDQQRCSRCSGLKQCRYCPTEFQIDHKNFGKRGIVVYITRWMDFGAGLTAFDPKWQSHVKAKISGTRKYKEFEFAPGSIRSAFELQERSTFESIMTWGNFYEVLYT